ncbi:MAG: DUF6941 family protein [Pseudonocardiaceae bacterium]
MEAHVLLADFAQTDMSGKVNALGLGWSVTQTPTSNMTVVVMVKVGWNETNQKHRLSLNLLTADGQHAVNVPTPLGIQPLQVEGEFEAGRPAGLPEGSTVDHAIAVNVGPGLALTPGRYEWRLKIDNDEEVTWRAAFVVLSAAGRPGAF